MSPQVFRHVTLQLIQCMLIRLDERHGRLYPFLCGGSRALFYATFNALKQSLAANEVHYQRIRRELLGMLERIACRFDVR